MGEAKRRKQLDPNYGKNNPESVIFYRQMLDSLPTYCKPDMGHRLYKEKIKEEIIILSRGCLLFSDPDGIEIFFRQKKECATILLSRDDAKLLFKEDTVCHVEEMEMLGLDLEDLATAIQCTPMPELRHQTISGEWVIPLKGKPIKHQ